MTGIELVVKCEAMCSHHDYGIWGINTVTTADGKCTWFTFDETTGTCNLCFPDSTLPILLNFDNSTMRKIFANSACK